MIVYDHFHQQIVFTVLAEKGEKGEKEAAEKMKEMEAEVKRLAQQEKKILEKLANQ